MVMERLFHNRFFSRVLGISFATALSTFVLLGLTGPNVAAPAAKLHVKVYLMRGFANVFSLGMDEMAAELKARGIPAEAYNHLLASSLSAEAAADYKSGKTKTIIIVGHSLGGEAVVSMVEELGRVRVPVALAVTLDISPKTVTDGKVTDFLNFYVTTGALKAGSNFHGHIKNIDISKKLTEVDHMTIDKNKVVQRMIMANINRVIGGGGAQPAASDR